MANENDLPAADGDDAEEQEPGRSTDTAPQDGEDAVDDVEGHSKIGWRTEDERRDT